ETPMLTGVTETAAGDIESADFGGDGRANENQNEQIQDQQSSAVENPEDQGQSTEDFQPGQIKRQPHTYKPRQHLEIVDIKTELDRIKNFDHAGVNENAADNHAHNSPGDLRAS